MIYRLRQKEGMVLVLALWILSILAIFAFSIGLGVRQKISLVSRLERREAVHYAAKAGIQKARAALRSISDEKKSFDVLDSKKFKYNNPDFFRGISTGEGIVEVSYQNYDQGLNNPVTMYGFEDEERKLNINAASREELQRLFMHAAGLNQEGALDLANAIIDWRTVLDQEIAGFYSDEYYSNLNFPYEPKKKDFEFLEEVVLVKGMNPEIFIRVKDFLTVYGDGRVNINTAPKPVLLSLGMTWDVVDLIIRGRNGKDQLPATADDYFLTDNGGSLQLEGLGSIKPEQSAQIDQLYAQRKILTISEFFRIHAKALLTGRKETRFIDCAVQAEDGRILAWREY